MIQSGMGIGKFCNLSIKLPEGNVDELPHLGQIMHWPNTVATIPVGWALCDGTVYASLTAVGLVNPDMRGLCSRAPNHINAGGALGGSDTHTHTDTFSGDPAGAHFHTGTTGNAGAHNHTGVTGNAGVHNHTGNTGNGGTHDHTGVSGAGTAHNHGLSTVITDNSAVHAHGVQAGVSGFDGGVGAGAVGAMVVAPHTHNFGSVVATNNAGIHNHPYTGGQETDNEDTHMHDIVSVGDHSHVIGNVADHSHNINNQVDHNHSLSTAPTHTHSVVGSPVIANNVPVYKELHFIIKV